MYKENIQFNLRLRLCNLLRQALKKYTTSGKTFSSSKYGIDYKEIIEHLTKTLPLDFNEKKYHIDHIKPISSFNLESNEEVSKCFNRNNLQWLEARDNIIKGNKF